MTPVGSRFRLIRWLGPWAGSESAAVCDDRGVIRDRTTLRVYGGDAKASVVIVPGLHFNGVYDFRMDRVARALAASGLLVVCPDITSHRRLRTSFDAVRDVRAALDEARSRTGAPPLGFSISFGCLPLIQAASTLTAAERLAGLVVFGGYGSWSDTIRFALTGRDSDGRVARHDPLNAPVVVGNLLAELETGSADVAAVEAAWVRYVRVTWGQPHMKEGGWSEVASRMAAALPAADRALFLMGCNLDDRAVEPVSSALKSGDWGHLDPLAAASQISCPVRVVHGRDDDVIPLSQADVLAEAFTASPDVRVLKTGLYSHSEGGASGSTALWREARVLMQLVEALVTLPRTANARPR